MHWLLAFKSRHICTFLAIGQSPYAENGNLSDIILRAMNATTLKFLLFLWTVRQKEKNGYASQGIGLCIRASRKDHRTCRPTIQVACPFTLFPQVEIQLRFQAPGHFVTSLILSCDLFSPFFFLKGCLFSPLKYRFSQAAPMLRAITNQLMFLPLCFLKVIEDFFPF